MAAGLQGKYYSQYTTEAYKFYEAIHLTLLLCDTTYSAILMLSML